MRRKLLPVKGLFVAGLSVMTAAYACFYQVTKFCHADTAQITTVPVAPCGQVPVFAVGDCYQTDVTTQNPGGQTGRTQALTFACQCYGCYTCNGVVVCHTFDSATVTQSIPDGGANSC